MDHLNLEPKTGAYFFAQSLIGQTIQSLESSEDGTTINMRSGLRAKVVRAHSADIGGEKIIGFDQQFPKTPKVITLNFASGKRAVIEL